MAGKLHVSHYVPLVENIAISADELLDIIKNFTATASSKHEPQILVLAGMFDMIVWPGGNIQFIPFSQFKSYKLDGEMLVEQ
jgi:hypothetical protein